MNIKLYFMLFIIYSFLGWLMEVTVIFIATKKKINRGFLIGPACPIYGCGCLLIVTLLKKYETDPLILFVMSSILCSILEYFTSYIMEKIFKARWWDYSNRKFNVNGRICLSNSFAFGFLASLIVYLVNPYLVKNLRLIPSNIMSYLFYIILLILIVDTIISLRIIISLKITAKSIKKDNTEEITKKVKEILIKKGGLYKRLVEAFNFVISDKILKEIKNKVQKTADSAKKAIRNGKDKITNLKKNITKEKKTSDGKRKDI